MKEVTFDCLEKDYDENYRGKKASGRAAPEPREEDELFAFKWPDLPERVQEAVACRIRHMYGLSLPHEIVLKIFKCLVARDVEIPMPWIEVEKGGNRPPGKFYVTAFNEETFKTETKAVTKPVEPAGDAYCVHEYVGKTGAHRWLRDSRGYAMLEAHNANLLTGSKAGARMYDYGKAEGVCAEKAERALLAYLGGPVAKGNAAFRALKQLDGRDWTKKGSVRLTKADFMERPRDFSDGYSRCSRNGGVDRELLEVIKKYSLSPAVDWGFIGWIASGCRASKKGAKKSKLSVSNCSVATAVNFPELTRANVVDCYHGLPGGLFKELKPGDAFTCGKNGTEYVVFREDVVDNEKVIAYAKAGTTLDAEGFIDPGNIMLGIDEFSVETCWDGLFEVNRRGRRKKILKIRSVKKAVKERSGE